MTRKNVPPLRYEVALILEGLDWLGEAGLPAAVELAKAYKEGFPTKARFDAAVGWLADVADGEHLQELLEVHRNAPQ